MDTALQEEIEMLQKTMRKAIAEINTSMRLGLTKPFATSTTSEKCITCGNKLKIGITVSDIIKQCPCCGLTSQIEATGKQENEAVFIRNWVAENDYEH